MFQRSPKLKYVFAFSWLALTMGIAIWWVFVLHNIIVRLEAGVIDWSEYLPKLKNMVFWEGLSLVVLILIGAVPLLFLIYREEANIDRIRKFFLAFSHDLKTSMASLKLQAEVLQESIADKSINESNVKSVVDRLLGDTERLHLQLENSLYLARSDSSKLFIQKVSLSDVIESMRLSWPDVIVHVHGKMGSLQTDRQALEGVLNNIFHNSLNHGQASEMHISITENDDLVEIDFVDNGLGFKGDFSILTQPFTHYNPSSGSGMGLYISHAIIGSLNGSFSICPELVQGSGFAVRVSLPKGVS